MKSKRKACLILAAVVAVSMLSASPALAGGDKVRGDNGQGSVNQTQIQDPPPFSP